MPIHKAIYNGPPRSYGANKTAKDYIVIHNTSNDAPAQNEASYAKRRADSVSSHYYVDDERIIQSLNTDYRAFHVGSSRGNSAGISYEITGTNSKSESWWKNNVAWDLLAKQIRVDCAEHGITVQTLTIDEIRAGKKSGIITHDQARRAWGGTDHTDPGPNFPMGHLIALVKGEAAPSKPSTPKPTTPPSSGTSDWTQELIMSLPTLRRGADGAPVKRLQGLLHAAGERDSRIDGDFGPGTERAVKDFQRAKEIGVDGIVGRQTWTKLIKG